MLQYMKHAQRIVLAVLFCSLPAAGLMGLNRTPEEVIDALYGARMMQNTVKLELLARHDQARRITKTGAAWLEKFLISYTISELKVKAYSTAYARVELKVKSVADGLLDTVEYWKLEKRNGIWVIINIFFKPSEAIRRFLHQNMSLETLVEKLIELDQGSYMVEVEEEYEDIVGTPFEKSVFFFNTRMKYRGNFRRAIEQIDIHIAANRRSGNKFEYAAGLLYKGLYYYFQGRDTGGKWYMDEGQRLINLSMAMDSRMYLVLRAALSGGGKQSYNTSRATERRTESRSYDVDKMFTH